MSTIGDPSAWEYDYPSPTGMGRQVTLSPPWLFDPDGVRNGRPLYRSHRSPCLTDDERSAVKASIDAMEYLLPDELGMPESDYSHKLSLLRGLVEGIT